MATTITAPQPVPDPPGHAWRVTVFLAGGITGCWDWQFTLIAQLADLPDDVLLLNPRRPAFPIDDPDAAPAQIAWEFQHLAYADLIVFYFAASPSSGQPIALYELGRHLALGKPVAVAVEYGYLREQDVRIQADLARPGLPIGGDSLTHLADAIRHAAAHPHATGQAAT